MQSATLTLSSGRTEKCDRHPCRGYDVSRQSIVSFGYYQIDNSPRDKGEKHWGLRGNSEVFQENNHETKASLRGLVQMVFRFGLLTLARETHDKWLKYSWIIYMFFCN